MSINWDDEIRKAEEATAPIALGEHSFLITSATPTRAQQSNNQMIKMVCQVQTGPDVGKVAYPNIVFPFGNDKAMKMTLKRLRGLGITKEVLTAGGGLTIDQIATKLAGRTVRGVVTHRQWNGETVSDVDFLDSNNPTLSGAAPVPGVPNMPTAASTPAPAGDETPPIPTIPPTTEEEPF